MWRRKAFSRVGTGVVAVVVLAGFVAGIGWEITTVHGSGSGGGGNPPPNCPVLFVAVPGSAEYPSGNKLSVSAELNSLFNNVQLTDGGAIYPLTGVRVLPYSAASVDVLTSGLGSLDVSAQHLLLGPTAYLAVIGVEAYDALSYSIPQYLDSEHEGVTELWTLFNTERSKCVFTKFVLAGYSQGAMVVHDFLNQLAAIGDTRAEASIIGAVLLGDPYRVKNAGVHEFGSAPYDSSGICTTARLVAQCAIHPRMQDVAPIFQSRTVSVCAYDDPVCDTTNFVPDLVRDSYLNLANMESFVNLGKAIHGSYTYIQPAALAGQLMGRFVAASVG